MKQKVLSWVNQFSTFCFFDNHRYRIDPHTEECLAAAGIRRKIQVNAGNALEQLELFCKEKKNWIFGHISYDIKNEIESLYSANADYIGFPDLFFFEPEVLVRLSAEEIIITAEDPAEVYKAIKTRDIHIADHFHAIAIKSRFSKSEYVAAINRLKQHIVRGDCYEINFCQEFYAENVSIDPLAVYNKLCNLSPNPFSALYRVDNNWLICASPERFLKKSGNTLLSQPMKGTAKRVAGDENTEEAQKQLLRKSTKDQSENVMVVDLVRNDLSKICSEGTVKVDELFGVYAFPRVYQMISTVSGELKHTVSLADIFRATFPMGSMTGAPKKKVMELIEDGEKTKRGIFSGTVGYINPEGDFDFNVVIRSIMFNAANKYLSFQAGSGITFYSEAEKEWEECLLKAGAIKEVLEGR